MADLIFVYLDTDLYSKLKSLKQHFYIYFTFREAYNEYKIHLGCILIRGFYILFGLTMFKYITN